ncbi:hypothetical protein GJ744_002496 [Endocarpon pusillum]|uniref:Uncharacterized protein n=1 Tax=Endocarpon pusillum TaxID=364733 RepID=A0A8H7ABV9_9EURO|nr:hypothetical protein GJ744_002496 [Endocarpon pusillum]
MQCTKTRKKALHKHSNGALKRRYTSTQIKHSNGAAQALRRSIQKALHKHSNGALKRRSTDTQEALHKDLKGAFTYFTCQF